MLNNFDVDCVAGLFVLLNVLKGDPCWRGTCHNYAYMACQSRSRGEAMVKVLGDAETVFELFAGIS